MTGPVAQRRSREDCVERKGSVTLAVGDLDQRRNLKVRAFYSLVLEPLFDDLQKRLRFASMIEGGVMPGQYYQDFHQRPALFGYASRVETLHRVRLRRATGEPGAPGRLLVETWAEVSARQGLGPPAAVGFDPALGETAVIGEGRVYHVLSRAGAAPGQRQVSEPPAELAFLAEHPLEGAYPTAEALTWTDVGFSEVDIGAAAEARGVWGIANSDVYRHVNAREYLVAMENAVTAAMAESRRPLERCFTERARTLYRRPSHVGERYRLRLHLLERGDDVLAIGAFHGEGAEGADERPSTVLRFEGRYQ